MTIAFLSGVALRGVHACVPADFRTLREEGIFENDYERERLEKSIGVLSRHVAPQGMCTSDLCQHAAEHLLLDLGWSRDSVDVLVLVTQSSDFVIPSTACALQHRLGLSSCLSFDINLGCSGYAYGLWTAASLLKTLSIKGRTGRALLLAGDVSTSKLMNGDRATVPLFGDAGSASALEIDDTASTWTGVFGTDGGGERHILVEAGGLRKPLLPPKEPHDESTQRDLFRSSRLHLNGVEVFNFTLRSVPALIHELLQAAQTSVEKVDYFLLHQANLMMLKHLIKKAGLPETKAPISMETYGNTSSASIPLTIADKLSDSLKQEKELVMVGFGVGWSWSAINLRTQEMPTPRVIEFK